MDILNLIFDEFGRDARVVSDGDECAVVEQCDEHEHQHGHLEEGRPVIRLVCSDHYIAQDT
jgi:hypothetical protein